MTEIEVGDPLGPDGVEIVRIEGDEPTAALAPMGLFNTDDPMAVIAKASEIATALASVVKDRGLASNIQGKNYVRVEGWSLLGAMLQATPVTEWTKPVWREGDDARPFGWESRVYVRRGSQVIAAAEAMCCRDERTWSTRDNFALRSMAQTRATSKALRLAVGFIMSLAGYEGTPADEVPDGGFDKKPAAETPKPAPTPEIISLPRAQFLAAEYARKLPKHPNETAEMAQARRLADARRATGNAALDSFKSLSRTEADALQSWLDSIPGQAQAGGSEPPPAGGTEVASPEEASPVSDAAGADTAGTSRSAPARSRKPRGGTRPDQEIVRRVRKAASEAKLYDARTDLVKLDDHHGRLMSLGGPGESTCEEIAMNTNCAEIVQYLESQQLPF